MQLQQLLQESEEEVAKLKLVLEQSQEKMSALERIVADERSQVGGGGSERGDGECKIHTLDVHLEHS